MPGQAQGTDAGTPQQSSAPHFSSGATWASAQAERPAGPMEAFPLQVVGLTLQTASFFRPEGHLHPHMGGQRG